MEITHHELTLKLWDLLTKEEIEKGQVYVAYDIDISTLIKTGSSMIDQIKEKSPFRDHIIGFKRDEYGISIVLDDEGQRLWNEKEKEMEEWMNKHGY